MSENHPYVSEAVRETFENDVIERSKTVPVVVDFWASWCQPCRTLGPILEKLATEFEGKFVLVKVNTEALPEFAEVFGVRSIPAVFGLRDGKVIDAFVGALPETQIRAWLEGIMPTPAELLVQEAAAAEFSDPELAESKYRSALVLAPDMPLIQVGLARVLVARGMIDEARGILKKLEARGYLEPEAEALKAQLAIHDQAEGTGGVAASRAALAEKPDDPHLKLKLAEALAASGPSGYDDALALALGLYEDHRKAVGTEAHHVMLNIFQLLPPDSELAAEYRRKLSAAMY